MSYSNRLTAFFARTFFLVLFVILVLAVPSFAWNDDYPSPWRTPTTQDSLVDTWGEWNRECTSFVAFRLHSRNGYEMTWHDNASGWPSHVPASQQDNTPAVGAVAWFASPGHVAWVEAVNGPNITIEEYNYSPAYGGLYSERTILASAVSKFLHFKDLTVTPPPPLPVKPIPYDYGGDGHPDLMCYSKSAGHLRYLTVQNNYAISPWNFSLDSMPMVWKLIGTADFNGDGQPDLVWYNVYAGHVRIQLMSGGVANPNSWIACYNNMPLNWQPVGIADFDGDGNPDIVWHEVNVGHVRVQLTHNMAADPTWYAIDDNFDPSWQIVGLGDFDKDGHPDLVWHSLNAGHIRIQLVHNLVGDEGNWIACLDSMPLNWQPVGAADFDGDGTPDLVFYDTVAGNIRIKLVHNYVADSSWYETYNGLGTDWRPVGMIYRGVPIDTTQFQNTGVIVPLWPAWATADFKKASVFLP